MKKIIFFAFLLLSCEQKPKDTISKTTENEAVVKKMFEHFNQHDWQSMVQLYADTALYQDPAYGTTPIKLTHADCLKKYNELQQQIPDVQDAVKAIYPSGNNHVIVAFETSGTGPDGKKFMLPICTIFKVENGKITEDFTYYDNF